MFFIILLIILIILVFFTCNPCKNKSNFSNIKKDNTLYIVVPIRDREDELKMLLKFVDIRD